MFTPVILAGGSGSRLWPLSRQSYPKQFLALNGASAESMFQQTLARLDGLEHGAPIVVTNEQHRFLVAEQLRLAGRSSKQIILEPIARNTAPAIALAAFEAMKDGGDPVLLVMPADHHIADEAEFRNVLAAGQALAENGRLVTFGIKPTSPETGFGYIECGEPLPHGGHAIASFKEKPALERAQAYLQSGDFLWNAGIFMFRASRFLNELKTFAASIYSTSKAAFEGAEPDRHFLHVTSELFARCDDLAVDYAVMERTEAGAVVPLAAGWNDLGSWAAIWEVSERDAQANVTKGDVICVDTQGSLVHAGHRLVAAVGVEDLVIVETKDAVLVANRSATQAIKEVVRKLESDGRTEHAAHPMVSRPWGHYDTVDHGERYQVKRITVLPGECLSLQLHYHRAEHWIVVSGTAKVVCGDTETILSENQSTYIPLGVKHSLSNPGKVPLELIEVQSGIYLGEDDIVRFEDRYGRVK